MSLITLDQIKAATAEVVVENPNAINPLGETVCLYTKRPDDQTPNVAEHCLGGAVLLKLGLRLPPEAATVSNTPDVDKFDSHALLYLTKLQRVADNFDGQQSNPRKWSEALSIVNTEF